MNSKPPHINNNNYHAQSAASGLSLQNGCVTTRVPANITVSGGGTFKLGKWRSKETGLVVEVIKSDADVVWWENKNVWGFACETTRPEFENAMEAVE